MDEEFKNIVSGIKKDVTRLSNRKMISIEDFNQFNETINPQLKKVNSTILELEEKLKTEKSKRNQLVGYEKIIKEKLKESQNFKVKPESQKKQDIKKVSFNPSTSVFS